MSSDEKALLRWVAKQFLIRAVIYCSIAYFAKKSRQAAADLDLEDIPLRHVAVHAVDTGAIARHLRID